jgi:hypothetical protein
MLKNAHLLRSPVASPPWRRGRKSLLIRRDATLRISGALHLGIFEHPGKNHFLSSLLLLHHAFSLKIFVPT